MRIAQREALRRAGVAVDQVDLFDLYSCFGSAIAFATDALGLADDDPRPRTLTGGLPYHGGPGSNYMSHSISHAVDRLRRGDGSVAMVTGVGMHMTKHVAAVYSREPGVAADAPDHAVQQNVLGDEAAHRTVVDGASGPAVVRAAAVVYGRNGNQIAPWPSAACPTATAATPTATTPTSSRPSRTAAGSRRRCASPRTMTEPRSSRSDSTPQLLPPPVTLGPERQSVEMPFI